MEAKLLSIEQAMTDMPSRRTFITMEIDPKDEGMLILGQAYALIEPGVPPLGEIPFRALLDEIFRRRYNIVENIVEKDNA